MELRPEEDEDRIEGDGGTDESLVGHVMRRFVELVIFARTGNGSWRPDAELSRFEVRLKDDTDDGFTVRINDEDCCWSAPVAARDFAEHDTIGPADVLVEQLPLPHGESNRYIRGSWDGTRWNLEMKLSRPHPRRVAHARLGAEFMTSARDALGRDALGVFTENAFHAAEHLALAELLSYDITLREVVDAKSHKTARTTYQTWAQLGNTEQRFARLLTRLDEARGAATYLRGSRPLDAAEAMQVLADLEDMEAWVAGVVHGDGPRTISLVATRAIDAGELIGLEDAQIRPSRTAT